jgi:hypothetical protein
MMDLSDNSSPAINMGPTWWAANQPVGDMRPDAGVAFTH